MQNEVTPSWEHLPSQDYTGDFDPTNPATDDVCTGGPLPLCCLPGIEVDNLGQISLPLSDAQATQFKRIGKRVKINEKLSPASTLRPHVPSAKTWKIPASQFCIWNAEWESSVINPLLKTIREKLGMAESDGGNFVCTPAKLLLTIPGDSTLDETIEDIDEDIGAFATLIIVLPSKYDSGQIVVVEHIEAMNDFNVGNLDNLTLPKGHRRAPSMVKKEIEHVFDFAPRSAHGFHYAAYLKSCPVTYRPVSSGYRLCLVYDLIFKPSLSQSLSISGAKVNSPEQSAGILMAGTVEAIERWTQPSSSPRTKIVHILGCKFADAANAMNADSIPAVVPPPNAIQGLENVNFQSEVLYPLSPPPKIKGSLHQEHLKSVLKRMCDATGLDVFVVNLTLRVRGDAHSKWYHGNSIWEMGEERVREVALDGWIKVGDKDVEDLGTVDMEVRDLAPESVSEVEKEWCDDESVQPAGWNEGTAMLRIYRRAAVVLWRKQETYRILCQRKFAKLVKEFHEQVLSDMYDWSILPHDAISRDMALGILDHFSSPSKTQSGVEPPSPNFYSNTSSCEFPSNLDNETDEKTVLMLFDAFVKTKDKILFKQLLGYVLPKLYENSNPNGIPKSQSTASFRLNVTVELLEHCIAATDVFGWDGVHDFIVNMAKRSARHGDLSGVVLISQVVSQLYMKARESSTETNITFLKGTEACFHAVANGIVALFDATRTPAAFDKTTLEGQLLELLQGFAHLNDSELDKRFAIEFLPRVFDGPRGFPGIALLKQFLKEDGSVVARFGTENLQKVVVLLAQSTARKGNLEDIKQLVETVMTEESGDADHRKQQFKQIADCVVNHFAADRNGYSWAYLNRSKENDDQGSSVENQVVELIDTFSRVDDNTIRRRFAVQLLPKVFAVSRGSPGLGLVKQLLDERGDAAQKLGAENLRRLVLLLAQNRAQAGKVGDLTKLLEVVVTLRGAGGLAFIESASEVSDSENLVLPSGVDPIIKSVAETILSHLTAAPRTEVGEEISLTNNFIAIGDQEIYAKFLVHVLPRLLVGGNGEDVAPTLSVPVTEVNSGFNTGLPSGELLSILLNETRKFGWESLRPMLSTTVQRSLRRGMVEDVANMLEQIVGLCSPFLPPLPTHKAMPAGLTRSSSIRLSRNTSMRSVASDGAYTTNDDAEEFAVNILPDDFGSSDASNLKSHPLLDIARDLARMLAQSMIDDIEEPISKLALVPGYTAPAQVVRQAIPHPPRTATFVHTVFVILNRLSENEILKDWISEDVLLKPSKYPLATAVIPAIYSLRAYLNPPHPSSFIDGKAPAPQIPSHDSGTPEPIDDDVSENRSGLRPGNQTVSPPVYGYVTDSSFIALVKGTVEVIVRHPLLRSTQTYLMQIQQQGQWDPSSSQPPPPPPTPFHPMIPPMNWRINRQIRCSRRCADCKQLQAFLRHSAQVTARYALPHRRREHLQRELERAVIISSNQSTNMSPSGNFTTMSTHSGTTDLTTASEAGATNGPPSATGGIAAAAQEVLGEVLCETLKEGTPHALVITKTRRVYEENWRSWARATVAALIGGGPAKDRENGQQHNVGLFVPEILQLGTLVPHDFWRTPVNPNIPSPPAQQASQGSGINNLNVNVGGSSFLRRNGSLPASYMQPLNSALSNGSLSSPPTSPNESINTRPKFLSYQHPSQQQYNSQMPFSTPSQTGGNGYLYQSQKSGQYPQSPPHQQWIGQPPQQQSQQQQPTFYSNKAATRSRLSISEDMLQGTQRTHFPSLSRNPSISRNPIPPPQQTSNSGNATNGVEFPAQGQHGWR